MIDHTIDLIAACHEASESGERATRALIFADWLEDTGRTRDAEKVRQAIESGTDGLVAATSVPAGGAGEKAGEAKVIGIKNQYIRFRWCPPGVFTMGSPLDEEGRFDNETQVSVRLSHGFWMGEVPVTQGLWECVTNSKLDCLGLGSGDLLPAYRVSHDESVVFAESLTNQLREACRIPLGWRISLPTEAQWEYACRAGGQARFPWGDDETLLAEHAWYLRNSGGEAHNVGTRRPNGWGLHDMIGNVREWCLDAWSDRLSGGDDPMADSSRTMDRVAKGGCWYDNIRRCRPSSRYWGSTEFRIIGFGFRIAMVHEHLSNIKK